MDYSPEEKLAFDAKNAQIEQAMRDAGTVVDVPVETDYFAFGERHVVYLPGSTTQWVEHTELNEGARTKYMNSVNRSVTQNRASGDMKIDMRPGDERKALLGAAITGWSLIKGGTPFGFTPANVTVLLTLFSPSVVDVIEKDIRDKNPWLQADMDPEQIQAEIDRLTELLEQKSKEEAGKTDSSS